MKHIALIACILLAGCTSNSRFVDGTLVQLGAYIPWESNLYGVELVSYVSGCALKASSNMCFSIEREYVATNSYLWGAVQTRERTNIKVDATK